MQTEQFNTVVRFNERYDKKGAERYSNQDQDRDSTVNILPFTASRQSTIDDMQLLGKTKWHLTNIVRASPVWLAEGLQGRL